MIKLFDSFDLVTFALETTFVLIKAKALGEWELDSQSAKCRGKLMGGSDAPCDPITI